MKERRGKRRLAAAAYVILYDGKGRTVSLLSQLGIKEKIPFVSTSVPANPNGLVADMPSSLWSARVLVLTQGRLVPSKFFDLFDTQTLDVLLGERLDSIFLCFCLGGLELVFCSCHDDILALSSEVLQRFVGGF
jgi:hypothetical protein